MSVAGVKNLLAGNQQAAVTVAVEGLMDVKANADPGAFITFDPKVTCQRSTVPSTMTSLQLCHNCVTASAFCVALEYLQGSLFQPALRHSRAFMVSGCLLQDSTKVHAEANSSSPLSWAHLA